MGQIFGWYENMLHLGLEEITDSQHMNIWQVVAQKQPSKCSAVVLLMGEACGLDSFCVGCSGSMY